MTVLSATLTSAHRYSAAEYRHLVYLANGWSKCQRWDGRSSSLVDAGITGPSQQTDSWTPTPSTDTGSNTSVGVHTFRYRYMDSSTGYVSEASEEREVTVAAGALELTFIVETTETDSNAAQIQLSTDSKVDRIVMEMTVVGGSEFFKAAEIPHVGGDHVVVDVSDATLLAGFLPWPETGHKPPPIAKYVVSHAERLWLIGQVVHSTGNADFTNSSADVDEGTTDPEWDSDTLGASANSSDVVWLIQKDGDDTAYEISYYDSGNSKIVLKENYGGGTTTDSSYKIFSRANLFWVSNPGYPEGFTPTKWIDGPSGEMSGDLTAGHGYGQSMLFYSLQGMYRFSWDQGPLVDPWFTNLSLKRGALSQRVVVEVEGKVYSMDHLGWHVWSGVFPKHISRPADDVLDSIDFDQSEFFHATFFPRLRAIRWFVCYSGETYPKHYVQYDVDRGTWGTGEYEVGISESRLVPTADGPKVYYGDENGHLWIADTGTCDGCEGLYSHLTVGAGATTTVIPVTTPDSSNLPITNAGLDGCMAHWVEGDEDLLVTANGLSSITVQTGFSSAPSDGDTIWLGSIPTKLKTKAFPAPRRGLRHVSRWRAWWLYFEPLTADRDGDSSADQRLLMARLYMDYSSTAFGWGEAVTSKNLPGATFPGNNTDYATTDWLLDLTLSDGAIRLGLGDFERTVELELEIKEPDAQVELVGFEFEAEEGERVR